MSEKYKAGSFNAKLDALLKGICEVEQPDELKLVKRILKEDFSDESRQKEETKRRLLDKLREHKVPDDDELNEEELGYASGGHAIREEGTCSKCSCNRSRISIDTEKCPVCGHSRDDHM